MMHWYALRFDVSYAPWDICANKPSLIPRGSNVQSRDNWIWIGDDEVKYK